MTWGEIVRGYFPEASDKDVHDILWCATCYPAGGLDHVEPQLHDLAKRARPAEPGWLDRVHQRIGEIGQEMRQALDRSRQA